MSEGSKPEGWKQEEGFGACGVRVWRENEIGVLVSRCVAQEGPVNVGFVDGPASRMGKDSFRHGLELGRSTF